MDVARHRAVLSDFPDEVASTHKIDEHAKAYEPVLVYGKRRCDSRYAQDRQNIREMVGTASSHRDCVATGRGSRHRETVLVRDDLEPLPEVHLDAKGQKERRKELPFLYKEDEWMQRVSRRESQKTVIQQRHTGSADETDHDRRYFLMHGVN